MSKRLIKRVEGGHSKPLSRESNFDSQVKSNKIKQNLLAKNLKFYEGKYSDVILDHINIRIIEALINDGDVTSSEISGKLKIPLSTIQRRRSKIEKSILKKKYQMDLKQLGYRTALIFVDIQGGKAQEIGEELLKKYGKNIVGASTRINSSNNLCIEVVYNGSDELHYLLEEIKSIPLAGKVDWSEEVKMLGDNSSQIIKNTLSDRLEKL